MFQEIAAVPVSAGYLNRLLVAGAVAAAFLSAGCTSTVRYTRGSKQSIETPRRSTTKQKQEYRKYSPPSGDRLAEVAARYIGIPYRYGGMSRRGTDCSGLVCLVFREANDAKLPHSTKMLRELGRRVSVKNATSGDLVFFRRRIYGRVNHVGIYLADGTFIHASRKRGVVYSKLDEAYYRKHFAEIRRVF